MRLTSNALRAVKPRGLLCSGGDSAIRGPSRFILNAQISVRWRRAYQTSRDDDNASMVEARSLASGRTPLTAERYFDSYTIPEDPQNFFTVGKVFNALSIEKALSTSFFNPSGPPRDDFQQVRYGEIAHAAIESYVVVEEGFGLEYCYCCIRHMYINLGEKRKSAGLQFDHVMLHGEEDPLPKRPEEEFMTRDPLRVWPKRGLTVRDAWLHLSLVLPQTYHQRVKEIGSIVDADVPKLLQYRKEVHDKRARGRVARENGLPPSGFGPKGILRYSYR